MKIFTINIVKDTIQPITITGFGFHILSNPRSNAVRVQPNNIKDYTFWSNQGFTYNNPFTSLTFNSVKSIAGWTSYGKTFPIILLIADTVNDVLPSSSPILTTDLQMFCDLVFDGTNVTAFSYLMYYGRQLEHIMIDNVTPPGSYVTFYLDNYVQKLHFNRCAETSKVLMYPKAGIGGAGPSGFYQENCSVSALGASPALDDAFIINKWCGFLDTRATIDACNISVGATKLTGLTLYSYTEDKSKSHAPSYSGNHESPYLYWYDNTYPGFNGLQFLHDTNYGYTFPAGPFQAKIFMCSITLHMDPNADPFLGV